MVMFCYSFSYAVFLLAMATAYKLSLEVGAPALEPQSSALSPQGQHEFLPLMIPQGKTEDPRASIAS